MASRRQGVRLMPRAGVGGLAGRAGLNKVAVRRYAVRCEHAQSQDCATALVAAAQRGRKETVELLLDRGADLEGKSPVRAAIVPRCATDRGGRHWWAVDCDGVEASKCRAHAACWRGRPCWRGWLEVSDGTSLCGVVQACVLAGWRYFSCCGCIRRPQGHGGAAAGPRRRPGGQGARTSLNSAMLHDGPWRASLAVRRPRWRRGVRELCSCRVPAWEALLEGLSGRR